MKMKTFDKKSDVVVRHTRGGDEHRRVIFEKDYHRPGGARQTAMDHAEQIANDAARDYGHGSASVFKGVLTLAAKPEMPTKE